MNNDFISNGKQPPRCLKYEDEIPIPHTEEGRKRLLAVWEECKPKKITELKNILIYGTNPQE